MAFIVYKWAPFINYQNAKRVTMPNLYSQKCTIQPKNLPITLDEAKAFLRITYEEDDQMLLNMISSAALSFQNYTSRALVYQTWEVVFRQLARISVNLPVKPVVSISKISLVALDGSVVDYSLKNIDLNCEASEIIFNVYPYGYLIKIAYVAGYGLSANDIPSDIKTTILNHVAAMYESRSATVNYPYSFYDQFKTMRL